MKGEVWILLILIIQLTAVDIPVILQSFDVTVGEYSPTFTFTHQDSNKDIYELDPTDAIQNLHVLYDETTGCYVYWTRKRVYRGTCGSFGVPSFPMVDSDYTGGFYGYDKLGDSRWNQHMNLDYYNIDLPQDQRQPELKLMRIWLRVRRADTRVQWEYLPPGEWGILWVQDHNGTATYVQDYQLPDSSDIINWITFWRTSDDNLQVREVRYYNDIPTIIERYFITDRSTRGFSGCVTSKGYVLCLIENKLLTLDLSIPGVSHRIVNVVDGSMSNDLSGSYRFILPWVQQDPTYLCYVIYKANAEYKIRKVGQFTERVISVNFGSEEISNTALVHGLPTETKYVLTTETGKVYLLDGDSVNDMNVQFGLGITSMYLEKRDGLIARGWLTLDVDLGIILQFDITETANVFKVTITQVIILGEEKPHTMIFDDSRDGLIILADNGNDSFVYIVPTVPSLKATNYKKTFEGVLFSNDAAYDSDTMTIRVSERECEPICEVYQLILDNCASYTCAECGQTNPVFCGSCGTSPICSDDISCGGINFIRGKSCPYLIGPSTALLGSSTGGTLVNFFFAGPVIENIQCIFDGIPVPSNATGETSFSCLSPSHEKGTVTISFIEYTDEYDFEYYNCADLDCLDCLDSEYSECGWNAGTAICETEGGSSIDYCPEITDIIPSQMLFPNIDENGSQLIVVSTGLSADVHYKCLFVELSAETLASVNGDSVECNTPSNTTLGPHTGVSISVQILSSLDNVNWQVHTQIQSPVHFVVNFCSDLILCENCLKLECEFCSDYSCSQSCLPLPTIDSCPVMNTPSIISDLTIGGSNITILVDDLFPVFTSKRALADPLLCVFKTESNKYNTSTDVNGNLVTCTTPTGVVPGIYDFYLSDSTGIEIVSPISFEFYDCPGKACNECFSYPKCEYCGDECATLNNCAIPLEGCPDIDSIFPTTVPYTGGEIAITTEYFSVNGNVSCVFSNIISEPLSIVDGVVSCTIPKSSPGLKKVYLIIGNDKTSIQEIEMYDCSHSDTCDDCLSSTYPECSVCSGSCQLQCPGQKQGCPMIENVSPLVSPTNTANITVQFVTTLPVGAEFRCSFAGVKTFHSTGNRIDENTLNCSIPNEIEEDSYQLSLRVRYLNKVDFTVYSVYDQNIYLFSCSIDLTCDESCFSEYCTFCPGTGCVGKNSTCTETHITSCPSISDASSTSFSVDTSKSISVTISGFIPPEESDLVCLFSDSDNVIYENPANISGNMISCLTPVLENTGSINLNIKYGLTIITTTDIDIFVVDCSIASICDGSLTQTLCINIEYCGWCVSSHSCVGLEECGADSILLVDSMCPQFEEVYPGEVKSIVDPVYLIGSYFHTFDVIARIVDDIADVRYVNETHLLIEKLPESVPRDQEIQIFLEFLDGTGDYFPYGRKFTVLADPISPEPNYLWLIILLSCVCLILIIVAIVLIRKKNQYNVFAGVNIILETPDFSELAFGKDGSVLEFTNLPLDNFDVFEELLVNDKSKVILSAFLDTLNPTDQDRGTKYFIYLTEINGCTPEFIQAAMEIEISKSENSSTIFRGNSNSSKMFKTYSKITGSPYLFDILGKYIQQLSAICDTELGAYNLELELDEHKAKDADLESNSMQLKFVCNKILMAILTSVDTVPLAFKEIFHHVELHINLVGFEDPDTALFAVGGLYFLRFVIPSIFAPHLYGLLKNPPSNKTQRSLVLIAKVLQNIANMVLPGKKEQFMLYLNSYIENSIPKVKAFYEQLTVFKIRK